MQKIFFGYLFIMVRFLVKGFDIFPDPIGYGLIYLGAAELMDRAEGFKGLKNIAMAGSLFSLAILGFDIMTFTVGTSPIAVFIVAILGSALNLLLIYMTGTKLMESFTQLPLSQNGVDDLDKLKRSWSSYFTALAISTAVTMYMILYASSFAFMIVMIAGILSFVFAMMVLFRLHRFTRNEANGIYTPEPPVIDDEIEY